jgi:hypothetical protein
MRTENNRFTTKYFDAGLARIPVESIAAERYRAVNAGVHYPAGLIYQRVNHFRRGVAVGVIGGT